METTENYGLIISHLRHQSHLSVRKFAKKIGCSVGWLSEIENSKGTARLTEAGFNKIVDLLDEGKQREMFRTWVANHKNKERIDRTLDGAVLKFIRIKKEFRLEKAAKSLGISSGYLSKIERGTKPASLEIRQNLMRVYGYNPSSFKNLSSDPIRSKAVPISYKLGILMNRLPENQLENVFNYVRSLTNQPIQNIQNKTTSPTERK